MKVKPRNLRHWRNTMLQTTAANRQPTPRLSPPPNARQSPENQTNHHSRLNRSRKCVNYPVRTKPSEKATPCPRSRTQNSVMRGLHRYLPTHPHRPITGRAVLYFKPAYLRLVPPGTYPIDSQTLVYRVNLTLKARRY